MNRPRRRFGQNFLHDQSVIDDIVDAIDPRRDQHLVEIGPGKGALTLPLIESGCRLDVIELDRDLVERWENEAERRNRSHSDANADSSKNIHNRLTVYSADALSVNFQELVDTQQLRLVGNLPYNISTPLLFHFLDHRAALTDLHVMLQKEVAERICAPPGSKTYGRLSVMLAPYFDSEILFDVPPEAFFPAPKVISSVLSIRVSETPAFAIDDNSMFSAVVKQAFSQRRKTLRKSLKTLCDDACFAACDIDASLRPEVLQPSQFAALANFLASKGT